MPEHIQWLEITVSSWRYTFYILTLKSVLCFRIYLIFAKMLVSRKLYFQIYQLKTSKCKIKIDMLPFLGSSSSSYTLAVLEFYLIPYRSPLCWFLQRIVSFFLPVSALASEIEMLISNRCYWYLMCTTIYLLMV